MVVGGEGRGGDFFLDVVVDGLPVYMNDDTTFLKNNRWTHPFFEWGVPDCCAVVAESYVATAAVSRHQPTFQRPLLFFLRGKERGTVPK